MLAAAIDLGYSRPKREASVENIAARVGIASMTAWKHLARAEAKIVAEIGDHLTTKNP